MKTLDRYDFRDRYDSSPSKVSGCPVGQSIKVNGHELHILDKQRQKDGYEKIVIVDGDDEYLLDLCSHWERGNDEPIKCCHEGALNLIKAVYAQTERDYEELYLAGEKSYPMEKLPGENNREFEARRKSLYNKELKKCEEFLGTIYTKYAKVRALWSISHDVNYIAEMVKSTPHNVACIIDRLGLNRAETAQNDSLDD